MEHCNVAGGLMMMAIVDAVYEGYNFTHTNLFTINLLYTVYHFCCWRLRYKNICKIAIRKMFNKTEHIGFQFTSEAVGKRWLKARLAYVIPTSSNIKIKNVYEYVLYSKCD